MMQKQLWKTIPLLLSLLICSLLLGIQPQVVQAQAAAEPPLRIVAVDTARLPTMQITLAGAGWPSERATAPLQVLVNLEQQTLIEDQTEQQAIGFMVAIDPNDLQANNPAGQTHYRAMTDALLSLIKTEVLLRNQDWLAADLLLPEGIQSIQEWTQEPNLLFNSIVQQQSSAVTGTPLATSTLLNALQRFQNGPTAATPTKTLLLFSIGSSALEVETVVAAAQAMAVQIHVIELITEGNPAGDNNLLAQIAQQSGGQYVALGSLEQLQPVWQQLAAEHTNRVLAFQSTVNLPQTVEVRLELPNGNIIRAEIGPEAFVAPPAPNTQVETTLVTATTPTLQGTAPQAETQSTVAYTPPVTASDQVAAAPPAADASSGAGAAAGDPSLAAAPGEPGVVVIPGSQIGLSRGLLQVGLVILLGLIGYFGYAEWRDRRKPRSQAKKPAPAVDRLFSLDENSQSLSINPARPQPNAERPVPSAPLGSPLAKAAPSPAPPARPSSLFQEEDGDPIEATIRPARLEDDEATYRPETLDLPIIGYLIRTTGDPNLPKELPIYGLKPGPGEVRQIHIGRHSKHNTVVINDKSVSREHAVLIQRQGRLYLRDNASTSGTFLNWKRLNPGEELLLRHKDLISFGQAVYEFRLQGEDEVTIAES